jgi:hypothetical protein
MRLAGFEPATRGLEVRWSASVGGRSRPVAALEPGLHLIGLATSRSSSALLLALPPAACLPRREHPLHLLVDPELCGEVALLAPDLVCDGSRLAALFVRKHVRRIAVLQQVHFAELCSEVVTGALATL